MTEPVLDGIRIVDLSWGLAGPVATQMLAEAGADVVKVEPPGGDPVRRLHPAAFATWNRSKRGIVLDLSSEEGTAQLTTLLAEADVVVHSMRAPTARRHGLDDATLTADFPQLVCCAITGYPGNHVDADQPGYDLLVQAREGMLDMQAGWREGPFASRFFAPSWATAFLAAAGILARLFHRERSGQGGAAHTSLAQGAHLIQNIVWNRAAKPSPSLLQGQPGTLISTQVAMYECSDGKWLQILNPADRVDLSTMPLMLSARAAIGQRDAPFDAEVMRAAMRLHPSEEWLEQIRARDVAVELISPLGSLLRHEQAIANDFVVEVNDPEWGRTRQAGAPFAGPRPSVVRGPAPRLGEHNADVIAELATSRTGSGSRVRAPSTATPTATAPTAAAHPLAGVRVVDFGAFLAGPLASMLLADLGADVIKVEPVTGDPVRNWRDGFYAACNRGKRGIALNIAAPEGREVVERLVQWADVVHHNIRLKAAGRLGLDGPAVQRLNPNAIYSHGSSYGLRGERADWPGYDSVFQAMAGWNILDAGVDNPPLFVHLGTIDTLTGASSAVATLLALYHRARTGEAGSAETALLNTATFTTGETLLCLDDDSVAPYPLLDEAQTGLSPGYRIYETADGWLAVAALTETSLAALCAVAGVDDPAQLADALHRGNTAELVDACARNAVPATAVRQFHWFDVWDDEDNRRAESVVSYQQQDWGQMEQFGAYWHLGDLSLALDRACPGAGQHTAEVLTELGFDGDHCTRLRRANVVAGPVPTQD